MRLAFLAILAGAAVLASCAPEELSADPVVRGRQLYERLDCGACHEPGLRNLWRPVGPPLDRAGALAGTRQAGVPAEEYLRRSIVDPGAYLVPGYPDSMPRGLGDRIPVGDLDALVRYLASLP